MILLMCLLVLGSCGSLQGVQNTAREIEQTVNEVQEIRLSLNDTIYVTKDGLNIGEMNIQPTRFRPTVNGVRYPTYYGITITYKF